MLLFESVVSQNLKGIKMEKKIILAKATVEYDGETNLFGFSKHCGNTQIKLNPHCMLKLIEALTETENVMRAESDATSGQDRTVYSKDLQENQRLKITLELTVFGGNWYVFLKQFYIPSRDLTGGLADGGVLGDEEGAPTADERVLAFKAALKMRLESTPKKYWVPVKGSVQLCPQDYNSVIEFATAMVQNC